MAQVNVNDRGSLERAYPPDAFAGDAAQNDLVPSVVVHGVRIGSAPDRDGYFALERAARHAGEPDTPDFLAPVRRPEASAERGSHGEPAQVAEPRPRQGYQQFLDDIVTAARHHGYRAGESPGPGDPRIRGLRQ